MTIQKEKLQYRNLKFLFQTSSEFLLFKLQLNLLPQFSLVSPQIPGFGDKDISPQEASQTSGLTFKFFINIS